MKRVNWENETICGNPLCYPEEKCEFMSNEEWQENPGENPNADIFFQ